MPMYKAEQQPSAEQPQQMWRTLEFTPFEKSYDGDGGLVSFRVTPGDSDRVMFVFASYEKNGKLCSQPRGILPNGHSDDMGGYNSGIELRAPIAVAYKDQFNAFVKEAIKATGRPEIGQVLANSVAFRTIINPETIDAKVDA